MVSRWGRSMKRYKSGLNSPTEEDLEFERILLEYRKVINRLKRQAIAKYGVKAARWFAK